MPDLNTLADAAAKARAKGMPPVHLWNPPDCGDIDMRIASDGRWFYCGTPVARTALVRLFASILRRDGDRHVLVTPVEMVGIRVDDAPFVAVDMQVSPHEDGDALTFRTNLDDEVVASAANPIRFEREPTGGFRPYVLVRGGLWAKVSRPVYLDMVDRAECRDQDGVVMLGVASAGAFFPIAPASEAGDCA